MHVTKICSVISLFLHLAALFFLVLQPDFSRSVLFEKSEAIIILKKYWPSFLVYFSEFFSAFCERVFSDPFLEEVDILYFLYQSVKTFPPFNKFFPSRFGNFYSHVSRETIFPFHDFLTIKYDGLPL